MADIFISLSGSDVSGIGTLSSPYRTFSHAYSVKKGDNRYVFLNTGSSGQSLFEEDPIDLNTVNNVTLYTDFPGTVFIKVSSINIENCEGVLINGIYFLCPIDMAASSQFRVDSSELTMIRTRVQDLNKPAILAVDSRLSFTSVEFHGGDSNVPLNILHISGVSTVKGTGNIKFEGNYGTALTITGDAKNVDISGLELRGYFSNAGSISYLDSDNSKLALSNIILDGSLNTIRPAGLTVSGANNRQDYLFINTLLAFNMNVAITFSECFLEMNKATIHNCGTAVKATDSSLVSIKNSIFTENELVFDSQTNSDISISYCNLYQNVVEYLSEYIAVTPAESRSMYGTTTYNLLYGQVQPNSELVMSSNDNTIRYKKNIDYIFTYGTEFVVGTITRIPNDPGSNLNGNIPNGEKVTISYLYKNPVSSTGSVTLGARIRHVDPVYVNKFIYNFSLHDKSPLIDSGIYIGFNFMGLAPDMGYYERTRDLTTAEAMTQLYLKAENDAILLEPDVKNTIALQIDNIKAYDSRIDTSEGSALRDLMIKPAGHLLDAPKIERQFLMGQQSILGYETMNENEMDLLAGNYFISRKLGEFATGTVRMYFNEPTDVNVPAGTLFQSGDSKMFLTIRNQVFLRDDILFNLENGLYYCDVAIQALSKGSDFIVAADTIRSSPNFTHRSMVSMTNKYGTENGIDPETNLQLYNRLKDAWTIRSLMSPRSIRTMLMNNFTGIRHINVIGARDPKMNRDVIPELIPYIGNYHVYGKIDVYCSFFGTQTVTHDFELDSNAQAKLNKFNTSYLPMIYISKAEVLDVNDVPLKKILRAEYELIPTDENYRFSAEEEILVKFNNIEDYANLKIRFTYETTTMIRDIQDYVNSDDVRNVCTDILIKHHAPKVVSCRVDYTPSSTTDVSENIVDALVSYINSCEPGTNVSLSNFGAPIINSGAASFVTPLSVVVEHWKPTGETITYTTEDEVFVDRDEHVISGNIEAQVI